MARIDYSRLDIRSAARELENLNGRLDRAMKNGASDLLIQYYAKQIELLSNWIHTEEDINKKNQAELQKIAGKRTLDTAEVKAYSEFKNILVDSYQHIANLEDARRKTNNQAEKDRIAQAIDDSNQSVIRALESIKQKFGDNSDVANASTTLYNDSSKIAKYGWKLQKHAKDQQELNELSKQEGTIEKENNKILDERKEKLAQIKKIGQVIWKELMSGADMWKKYNAQAVSDSIAMGAKAEEAAFAYGSNLMANSRNLMREFGLNQEQASKLQNGYIQATGRANQLTYEQMANIAASSKLMGEETVNSAMELMNNMGSTSDTTTELLDKNFARAANAGLNTVKASKEFVQNMSLANKLPFKNGVDGISKMTILSQRIKLNLQEVANVADKFGSIEGAIEGSAQLQMLGGAGAMFGGNPMEMMFEAMADPEALFERMGQMAGQQAVFNRTTGEAEIDAYQMAIMREQEKAMGMSPGSLIQSAKQQAKNKDIEASNRDLVARYGVKSDEIATIENKAEFNKESGWTITYLDKDKNEYVTDKVSELTPDKVDKIMGDRLDPLQDIQTHVRKIASELVSTKDREQSIKDMYQTGKAEGLDGIMQTYDKAADWVSSLMTSAGSAVAVGAAGIALQFVGKWALNKIGTKLGRSFLRDGSFTGGGVTTETPPTEGGGPSNTLQGSARNTRTGAKPRGGPSLRGLKPNYQQLRTLAKTRRFLRTGGRVAGRLAGPLQAALAVYEGYEGWQNANTEYEISAQGAQRLQASGRISERERQQREIAAANQRTADKGDAVGSAAGGLAGALAGGKLGASIGAIGGPVGMAIGGLIGGAIGGAIGAFAGGKTGRTVGEAMEDHSKDDSISKELEVINDSDEEENLRKIVLPIHSIDYNVALIANQLGIASATASRDNIYFKAEGMGDIEVSGVTLAETIGGMTVNPSIQTGASQSSFVGGEITLNINGTIELTGGQGVSKLSAEDIKNLIDNNPELQRHIADVITGRQVRNGNVGRNNNENGDNRRATTSGTYLGGM